MTPMQLKIQKTSRGVYIVMNVLKYFLIVGLVMLVLVSIWYADAYSRGIMEAQALLGHLLEGMMPVVPSEQKLQPMFFACLILQMVYQGIMIAGVGQMVRLFRDISRTGTPFAEAYLRPVRRVTWLAVAMFVVGTAKYGLESAMEAGVLGFYPDIDLGWVAALAFLYCLTCIYDYGCKLQRESDETL